jgi:hypothetical protein
MDLEFSSQGWHDWSGSLSLDEGKLTGLGPVGFNESWGDTWDPRTYRWRLTTEGRRKALRWRVQGRLRSTLRLTLGNETVGKTLGQILEPILSGKDVWQSRTLEVPVGETGRLGFIIRGQPIQKIMVAAE